MANNLETNSAKNSNRKIRVIIAKAGLDGHDRGAKVIAAAFRDSGIEVIYEAALQEDADAIGISILSGAHMTIFRKISEQMKLKDMNDVLLFGGGIIPKEDIAKLKEIGVGELFTPGTPTHETIAYVKKWVQEHRRLEV